MRSCLSGHPQLPVACVSPLRLVCMTDCGSSSVRPRRGLFSHLCLFAVPSNLQSWVRSAYRRPYLRSFAMHTSLGGTFCAKSKHDT